MPIKPGDNIDFISTHQLTGVVSEITPDSITYQVGVAGWITKAPITVPHDHAQERPVLGEACRFLTQKTQHVIVQQVYEGSLAVIYADEADRKYPAPFLIPTDAVIFS